MNGGVLKIMPERKLVSAPAVFGLQTAPGFSDRLLYVPDKGSQTQLFGLQIHLVQRFKQGFYPVVFHDGDDGRAHGRPGVSAEMGVAGFASASLHLFDTREAATVEVGQGVCDAVMKCLVVGYEYCFHFLFLIMYCLWVSK
jgi:hypothetical protein